MTAALHQRRRMLQARPQLADQRIAQQRDAGMVATGYMIPLIAVLEMIFGALLIVGRFVPLALTVFAPLIVNIALFHTLLAPAPPIVRFLLAAEIYPAWVYRAAFRVLLQPVPPSAGALA